METSCARLELCSLDPQEVESLKVDDVEAATAIYEYLRKSSVDDDRVDDEWIDTRADNPVGMIVTVKCDEGARPVEVLQHYHPCRKDLSMFPLALSGGELCCGPAIDHVAVMDCREPLIILTAALVVTLVSPLVVLLQPKAVEVFLQHTAILELVVGTSLVIRTRLLEHLVENNPFWGP